MEINKRLIAVFKELPAIKKDQKGANLNYAFRGIDLLLNELNPIMRKHDIFVTPRVLEKSRIQQPTKNGITNYSEVTIEYTFRTIDDSVFVCSTVGGGMDSGDKDMNKAITASFKSMLNIVFAIPTELDDSEKENHEIVKKEETKVPYAKLEDFKKIIIASPLVGDALIGLIRKAKTSLDEKYQDATDYEECAKYLKEKIEQLEGETHGI